MIYLLRLNDFLCFSNIIFTVIFIIYFILLKSQFLDHKNLSSSSKMIEENVSSLLSPPRYIFLTFSLLQAKRSKEIPPRFARGGEGTIACLSHETENKFLVKLEFWLLYHIFLQLFIQADNAQVHFEFGYVLFGFDGEGFFYTLEKNHTLS